ncbi:MAG: alanine--tRNA ligase [Bdellovibrionales bacterium]
MQSHDVRKKYIDYFAKNGHQPVASSRLIPENDPTLLFTNAGMNQFKNLFLGLEQRDYKRAVSSQKCVRAGGKHNDLENVGHTARHHTFFEMLGNFSFGDYFKKDAIHFAWELITKELAIDKTKLYVSVYKDDDEAADIWHKQEGVPKDRIYRFDQDNFWRMGDSGPCGPCSEIFYDLGPGVGGDPKENVMGGNGDRFMEFWNLVFMQFEEDGKGGRTKLPKPSVDTGMGLERMTNIMQGQINNYDTDLFQDLIRVASKISGHEYMKSTATLKGPAQAKQDQINVALRVLADHARATSFLIADGVLPSNEGRGYVLRRIMRRAIRYGRQLSEENSILPAVVDAVVKKMSDVYPELNQQKTLLERTVVDEEKRFLATLDQGTHMLSQELSNLKSGGTLGGEVLFKLYDTFGFPVDLTRIMAQEKGFKIDEAGFEKHLGEAKEKARASWKGKAISGDQAHLVQFTQRLQKQHGDTVFTGYDTSTDAAKLLALSTGAASVQELKADQTGIFASDKTCFYAEGGGPIGDRGIVRAPGGEAEVLDTTKQNGIYLHQIKVTDGVLKVNDPVQLIVTSHERRSTANNHSATHLMHAALRKVLGTHVQQAGSLVDPDRLRFDFTHNQPLTQMEIEQVENLVNAEVAKSIPVQSAIMTPKEAQDKGAMALFGEKYGDEVRVIQMGDFSMELCGGIHVGNTSQIRLFKIISEGGVSAGVRRIEAITGDRATEYVLGFTREALQTRQQVGLPATPGTGPNLTQWAQQIQAEKKELLREIQSLKGKGVNVDSIVSTAQKITKEGIVGQYIFADIPVDDRKVLSDLSDRLQDRLKDGVVVILGQGDGSHPLIVSVSKSLTGKLNAGKILGEVAQTLGGKGGGRPDFAQGAVPSRDGLSNAQKKVQSLLA